MHATDENKKPAFTQRKVTRNEITVTQNKVQILYERHSYEEQTKNGHFNCSEMLTDSEKNTRTNKIFYDKYRSENKLYDVKNKMHAFRLKDALKMVIL
jgi:hypothetical protein